MWWHKEKRDADAWEFIEIASTARLAYGKGRIIAMDLGASNFFNFLFFYLSHLAWNSRMEYLIYFILPRYFNSIIIY
jgi:hypothetical protein